MERYALSIMHMIITFVLSDINSSPKEDKTQKGLFSCPSYQKIRISCMLWSGNHQRCFRVCTLLNGVKSRLICPHIGLNFLI